MNATSAFENRLRKNARHFRKWAKTHGLSAYRIYDRDVPEWPFSVDWYDGRVQLVEYPRRRAIRSGEAAALRDQAIEAVVRVLEVSHARIYVKTREPKVWGREQYQRFERHPEPFVVTEQGLKFEVDLAAHLDTGLFLDHRITRTIVRDQAKDTRFLNLFAYTGSFTVYAAAGGARELTTVDLSNTYLDWAERNLRLNRLWIPEKHRLIRADVLAWLRDLAARGDEKFDLIVLDPPSFSTSSRMHGSFDVQRDQVKLLRATAALLAPQGTLYFSTNFQGFELKQAQLPELSFEELTPKTIPPDFHHKEIHRCWRVRHARGA
ncbi:MAG: class I SAM-dependent methyltransferase [Myxococcaceae bacterium]|nr:class I SAM-dependent methyltransferase [Myxococcaceae bacterium]